MYILITVFFIANPYEFINYDQDSFFEASVVGVDENGELLNLKIVNPLVISSVQLEKDVANLVYEELFTLDLQGNVNPVLIESYQEIQKGNTYSFKLKEGVLWHDGNELTTEDVRATFELLEELDDNSDTASSFSNVIKNQLDDPIIKNKYEFEISLADAQAVLPSFLESLTFKILPQEHIQNMDSSNALSPRMDINVNPIGTGKYKNLSSISGSRLRLTANESYHGGEPKIKYMFFLMFKSEQDALNALKTRRVHAISGLSGDSFADISGGSDYNIYTSQPIYNQYWALNFNLDENNGNPILFDKDVRRALALAINRDEIINLLAGNGEVSFGTIPKNSFAYNNVVENLSYNPNQALEILENVGWKRSPKTGILQSKNQDFEIDIVYVDNPDRNKVAELIKNNFEEIGISVELINEDINTLNNKHILPKDFDILFYGQETFIDVDRYELYHSSQIGLPSVGGSNESTGLNLSSYISEEKGIRIENQAQVEKPKVDILLEESRSIIDTDKRRESLFEFQEILTNEVPTIFLYHPKYNYVINKRIENVNVNLMNSQEGRFNNANEWEIID